jgi:uncharacterized protein
MSYYQKISDDLKKAMLAKDKEKLEAIRAVKTAFMLAKSEKSAEYVLSEEEELRILQKLVKQRKESAQIYKEQNRTDLYEKEHKEALIIGEYLPEMISGKELEEYIRSLIIKLGAKDIKDMGKVMASASKELAGKAEGREISQTVRNMLQ